SAPRKSRAPRSCPAPGTLAANGSAHAGPMTGRSGEQPMPITAFYAGLLGLLFIVLAFRVVARRRDKRVEIGDGGDRELLRRMRVHANFAEYAPFTLLLMGLGESLRPPIPVLHVIGLLLLAGRLLHAYGLAQEPHFLPGRVWGMYLTIAALVAAIAVCLLKGVQALLIF